MKQDKWFDKNTGKDNDMPRFDWYNPLLRFYCVFRKPKSIK